MSEFEATTLILMLILGLIGTAVAVVGFLLSRNPTLFPVLMGCLFLFGVACFRLQAV